MTMVKFGDIVLDISQFTIRKETRIGIEAFYIDPIQDGAGYTITPQDYPERYADAKAYYDSIERFSVRQARLAAEKAERKTEEDRKRLEAERDGIPF